MVRNSSSGTVEPGIYIHRNCGTRYIYPQELWNQVYYSSGALKPGIYIPGKCDIRYIHPQELRNEVELRNPVHSLSETVEPRVYPQELLNQVYLSSGTAEPGIFILRQCGTKYIHSKDL
jgi:hypothetical protein